MCNTHPMFAATAMMSGDSVVSALSSSDALSSSAHSCLVEAESDGIAFATLTHSPKKHKVPRRRRKMRSPEERRKRRSGKPLKPQRVSLEDDVSSTHHSKSEEVVKQLVSQISFTMEGEEYEEVVKHSHNYDADAISTVSSLGMGLSDDDEPLEDDDEEDDRSCGHDSIVRITSQIKMLRRSSMERFQATPTKKLSLNSTDSTKPPTLPSKTVDDVDSIPSLPSIDDQEDYIMPLARHQPRPATRAVDDVTAFEECSRQRFLPFLTTTANDLDIPAPVTTKKNSMSQSLPKDLHILAMPCRHDSDVELDYQDADDEDDEDDATSCTSFGSDTPFTMMRRTDRWGSGGSKSMERDCALVKESFEWAKELRLSCHSCHSSVDSGIHSARKVQSERSSRATPRDTMLVPPRRRF